MVYCVISVPFVVVIYLILDRWKRWVTRHLKFSLWYSTLKTFPNSPPLPTYEIFQILWVWLLCIFLVTFSNHFHCLKHHLYIHDNQTTMSDPDVSPGSRPACLNLTQHLDLCFKLHLILHIANLIINYPLWQSLTAFLSSFPVSGNCTFLTHWPWQECGKSLQQYISGMRRKNLPRCQQKKRLFSNF